MSSCYTHDPYARPDAADATVHLDATPTRVVQIALPSARTHGTVCYYYYSNVRSTPLVVKAVCTGSPASTARGRAAGGYDAQAEQTTPCPAPQLQLTQRSQQGTAAALCGRKATEAAPAHVHKASPCDEATSHNSPSTPAQSVMAERCTSAAAARKAVSASCFSSSPSSTFAASDSFNAALSSYTHYYCGLSTAEDGMSTPRQQCISPPVPADRLRAARGADEEASVMEYSARDAWLACAEPVAWLASSATAQTPADERGVAGRCCTPSPCRVRAEERAVREARQSLLFPQSLLPSPASPRQTVHDDDERETYAGPQEEDAAVQEATTWVELLLRYRDRENDLAPTASDEMSVAESHSGDRRPPLLPATASGTTATVSTELCGDVARRVSDTLATFAAQRARRVEALWQRSTFHPLYTDR